MATWRPRLSLRVRFALLMAAAVALLGGVNRLYFDTRLLSELESELEGRALGLGRQLAAASVEPILVQDLVGLEELLSRARRSHPDFAYAFVLDHGNQVLAHTFAATFPEALIGLNRFRDAEEYRVERIEVFGETYRDYALPLYRQELGVLRLGVSDRRLLARIRGVRRELLLLLFAAMLVSATGAYAFTYLGLRPLAVITGVLERFRPGYHREETGIRRHDEVGDLAAKVDAVTGRLHETYAQLMRTERLASVGVMASGIAHEINNPITGLQNCARRIRDNPEDAEQVRTYAGVMLDATEHVATVVRGLLDFSRGESLGKARVDLREVVTSGLRLAGLRLERRQIELERIQPDTPLWALGDEGRLTQVVVNLVLNAVDAMPEGGRLTVELSEDGEWLNLRIRDQGMGIPPERVGQVFDPFFSTKEPGQGTGLGLAVTHGIAIEHGGEISIESREGVGTEVTVRLPAPSQEASTHERA